MSVYLPPSFKAHDGAAIEQVIREHPFATLITGTSDEPLVSHVPLLFEADGTPQGTLIGHMARANPHWRHFGEGSTLAIFHGPHAYVSPSWYTKPAAMVPTWNYVVAHVRGSMALIDDQEQKHAMVRQLTGHFESGRAAPWQLQLDGERLAAMLGGIVGFCMTIERIDGKFKLSQNRSKEDREGVIAGLREDAYGDAIATAEWMTRIAREG
jgi:transcriptional regulator